MTRRTKTKIFVPYTEILPVTRMVLTPYNYEPVLMEGDEDYHEYFKQRWHAGESFINCEHDTVFWPGAVEELEQCPEDWCAFGTSERDSFVDGWTPPLSLTKFSSTFIVKYPDVWDTRTRLRVADKMWADVPLWLWCDSWLQRYTRTKGVVCHQHYPPVVNANPVQVIKLVQSNE